MGIKITDLISCSLCANLSEDGCLVSDTLNRKRVETGGSFAIKCPEFTNVRSSLSREIELDKALRFILAGNSEFILESVKTGNKLRYKIERKLVQNAISEDDCIYWVYYESSNGTLNYAGVMYYDKNIKGFNFGRGSRGSISKDNNIIVSLLFVVNKLFYKKTNLKLKIHNSGNCGKCGKKLTGEPELNHGICIRCLAKCDEQLDGIYKVVNRLEDEDTKQAKYCKEQYVYRDEDEPYTRRKNNYHSRDEGKTYTDMDDPYFTGVYQPRYTEDGEIDESMAIEEEEMPEFPSYNFSSDNPWGDDPNDIF